MSAALAAGCDTAKGESGGQGIPPPPPKVIKGEWTLEQPDPYVVEPGMRFELVVTGLSVDPSEVVVWLENDVPLYPYAMRVLEDGGDDSTFADDKLAFDQFVPYVTAGSHYVRLGTLDKPFTGEALLHVVIPERRLARQAVVDVMESGMHRTIAGLRKRTVGSKDENVKGLAESYLGSAGFSALSEVLDGADAIADTFGDDYAKLDDTTEKAVQSMLYHTGVLHWAEPRLDEIYGLSGGPTSGLSHASGIGSTSQALKVTGPFDSARHLVHQSYFEMDLTAAIAAANGEALGIVEIAFAVTGVGAPVSAAVAVVNVVNALVQVIIDNFLPTDLVSVEAHDQRSVFDGEPVGWVYWGTFQPENGSGDPLSIDTLVAEVISAAIPGGKGVKQIAKLKEVKRKAIEGFKAVFGTILARAGVSIADKLKLLEATPPVPVKMALNMQAYSFKLSDVLEKIPVLSVLANGLKRLVDLEFSKAAELDTSTAPAWASGATLEFDYSKDTITISGISWPAGTSEVDLGMNATLFAYKTKEKLWGFVRYPGFDEVKISHAPVKVREKTDPKNFNEDKTDEDFIVLDVYSPQDPGGKPIKTDYVESDTEKKRVMNLKISDLLANPSDVASYSVMVNGTQQVPDTPFVPQTQDVTLELKPGRNSVTIVAETEHQATLTFGKHLKVGVTVPSINAHTVKQFWLDVPESYTIYIWVPPAVQLSTSP